MLRRYRLTVTLEHESRRAIARIDIPWRCKTEISTLISNVIIGSTLKLPFLLLVDQFYISKWIIFTLVATPIARRRLIACLGSIGYHADYRVLIQLGASRYDKDGQIVGVVTEADVEDNLQRLVRRNKSNP